MPLALRECTSAQYVHNKAGVIVKEPESLDFGPSLFCFMACKRNGVFFKRIFEEFIYQNNKTIIPSFKVKKLL